MATGQQTVFSRGIYHGLPVFKPSQEKLTAIVTGANGISGAFMARALGQSPARWGKIYCMSRRPAAIKMPAQSEFIQSDLLKDPEEIAATLKGVKADYIFFYAYIQPPPKEGGGLWSDVDEMVRLNKTLLVNFLKALDIAGIVPKRFLLQTGAKYYGLHLGPPQSPMEEWQPRVELEPNFYYPQEDALFEWTKKHSIHWHTAMPSYIIGAVPNAAMSLALPLAIYASVAKHLGEKLDFPGSIDSWQRTQRNSSAMLNGYFEEWLVLSEETKDERFNCHDNTVWSWEMLWPRVAGWYGIDFNGPLENADYHEVESQINPPPRGYGPPGKLKWRYTSTDWAKSQKVQDAWKEIAKTHGLRSEWVDDIDAQFGFLDGGLFGLNSALMSGDKARKRGWNGFVDSYECMLETFEQLAELKMIPPVPKVKVSFL